MTEFDTSLECAQSLDQADVLRSFRDQFNIPEDRNGHRCVYLCGNSLGLQPKGAVDRVQQVLDDWGRLGVEGHFLGTPPWMPFHREASAGIADLVGANFDEVVTMNTLTVNLHILMASFYQPDCKRNKIIIESTAFPSDYFAVQSQIQLHGLDPTECLLEWQPRADELLYTEDLRALLQDHDGEVALMLLPGVQYYTGQVLDMGELCGIARQANTRIGLDLAHAIGNVPLELHTWAPDFAAWCTYKYVNSGPGAVGGAFVAERHFAGEGCVQLTGWWGHEESSRFKMARTFKPAHGAERWQLSNPPILSIAPILASLDLFNEADVTTRSNKSRLQTAYLTYLLEQDFAGQVETITPADARGCQLSLVVTNAGRDARDVFTQLEEMNVIGDWREPNVIRVAPVPLYNSFADIHEFARRLRVAMTL